MDHDKSHVELGLLRILKDKMSNHQRSQTPAQDAYPTPMSEPLGWMDGFPSNNETPGIIPSIPAIGRDSITPIFYDPLLFSESVTGEFNPSEHQ